MSFQEGHELVRAKGVADKRLYKVNCVEVDIIKVIQRRTSQVCKIWEHQTKNAFFHPLKR